MVTDCMWEVAKIEGLVLTHKVPICCTPISRRRSAILALRNLDRHGGPSFAEGTEKSFQKY